MAANDTNATRPSGRRKETIANEIIGEEPLARHGERAQESTEFGPTRVRERLRARRCSMVPGNESSRSRREKTVFRFCTLRRRSGERELR